jgi:hypothetical protein
VCCFWEIGFVYANEKKSSDGPNIRFGVERPAGKGLVGSPGGDVISKKFGFVYANKNTKKKGTGGGAVLILCEKSSRLPACYANIGTSIASNSESARARIVKLSVLVMPSPSRLDRVISPIAMLPVSTNTYTPLPSKALA